MKDLTTFFMSSWWGDSKNIEENELSRWLFEGRPRHGNGSDGPILHLVQKAIVGIEFLASFAIPSSSK